MTLLSEVKFIKADDGAIGWRLDYQHPDQDWQDVLDEVALGHTEQLAPDERTRWQEACDAGHGPDADADVNGIRWVVQG